MDEIPQFLKDLKKTIIVQRSPELARPYEIAIMPAVTHLRQQIKKEYQAQMRLQEERKQAIISKLPIEVIEHLDEQSADYVDNEIFLQQQMAVIAEMRLVYFYKSYEIIFKQMLIDAYNANTRNLFTLNSQKSFLESKYIYPEKIVGYKELNELRTVVNGIKHAPELGYHSKKIFEFSNANQITYDSGTMFYERIEPQVNGYIEKLSELIFLSLYPV